jgi:hypothetical protein
MNNEHSSSNERPACLLWPLSPASLQFTVRVSSLLLAAIKEKIGMQGKANAYKRGN